MNLIIHLTIEVENMADLGELMPTLVDLDPIDITVHAHQPIAADATPSGSPASGPVASQTVLDEINGLITAHDDQQPHSDAQERQPWDHSAWTIGERIDWLEGGLWGTDKRLTSLINEVDEHCEHIVTQAGEHIAHQATQIDDINRRLDDYLSRFNGLLADFEGLCTKVERMVTK